MREWHRMTRMAGPDCAVMGNSINTRTRAEERRRSAKKRKTVVDPYGRWETGETWVERGENVEKKGLVQ